MVWRSSRGKTAMTGDLPVHGRYLVAPKKKKSSNLKAEQNLRSQNWATGTVEGISCNMRSVVVLSPCPTQGRWTLLFVCSP